METNRIVDSGTKGKTKKSTRAEETQDERGAESEVRVTPAKRMMEEMTMNSRDEKEEEEEDENRGSLMNRHRDGETDADVDTPKKKRRRKTSKKALNMSVVVEGKRDNGQRVVEIVDEEKERQESLSRDLLETMLEEETRHREYTPNAKFLKYRADLVEWISDICKEMRCRKMILYSAVRYMDRILQTNKVVKDNLQLVAMCCFLIAAKYEGPEDVVPSISEAAFMMQSQYETDIIRRVEVHVLNKLGWDLTEYTAFHFLTHFLSAESGLLARSGTDEASSGKRRHAKKITYALMECAVRRYEFEQYKPSTLGAAVVIVGGRLLGEHSARFERISDLCGTPRERLEACVRHVETLARSNDIQSPASLKSLDGYREEYLSPRGVSELWA